MVQRRFIVTGASGFIGKMLIPRLIEKGASLLLVGRTPNKLQELYPGSSVTDYQNLPMLMDSSDIVIHLAVKNNEQSGTIAQFRKANVELLSELVVIMRNSQASLLVNLTSTHALKTNGGAYAQSKQEGEALLKSCQDIKTINLRCAAVHGEGFAGTLSFMNHLPIMLAKPLFCMLSALRATTHIDKIVTFVLALRESEETADVLLTDSQLNNAAYLFIKKSMDIGACFFIIMFFWWVFLLCWLAVKFSSVGGGIFVQTRIGRHGVPFSCCKFRTMYMGTKQAGTHEVSGNDITPVGRFLRRTRLDELPQLINIIKGEMSLVGPRPCLPIQRELIGERKARDIDLMLPGITGLAQVEGVDMSDPVRLAEIDAIYLKSRTLLLDAKIIIKTMVKRHSDFHESAGM